MSNPEDIAKESQGDYRLLFEDLDTCRHQPTQSQSP